MEALREDGLIARWGVSNFDADDMEDLLEAGGDACSTNQVLYNVSRRGPEYDLLPLMEKLTVPVTALQPGRAGEARWASGAGRGRQAPRGDGSEGCAGLAPAPSRRLGDPQSRNGCACRGEPSCVGYQLVGPGYGGHRQSISAANEESVAGDAVIVPTLTLALSPFAQAALSKEVERLSSLTSMKTDFPRAANACSICSILD